MCFTYIDLGSVECRRKKQVRSVLRRTSPFGCSSWWLISVFSNCSSNRPGERLGRSREYFVRFRSDWQCPWKKTKTREIENHNEHRTTVWHLSVDVDWSKSDHRHFGQLWTPTTCPRRDFATRFDWSDDRREYVADLCSRAVRLDAKIIVFRHRIRRKSSLPHCDDHDKRRLKWLESWMRAADVANRIDIWYSVYIGNCLFERGRNESSARCPVEIWSSIPVCPDEMEKSNDDRWMWHPYPRSNPICGYSPIANQ